jgi:2-amino-4-hydroxy-6-hydroxymethyldihydropteridine diphosphokinase
MVMARCLIGCGSNLGRRREQLDRAIELMRFMPGVTLLDVSRFRETVPVGGPPGQEAFLNGACLIETDLPPQEVLAMLAAVENTLHRNREERWGPRTVDLDLLLYDDLVLDSDCLTLPHPRMSTRRFVLEPCVEIAGEAVHPLAACTLDEMLASISAPQPHVAVVGVPAAKAAAVARIVSDSSLGCLVSAPRPLPSPAAPPAEWCAALSAWLAALQEVDCDEGAHGIVADFWLETLVVAARESLPHEPLATFETEFVRLAAKAVGPHAVLMLVAPPASLAADPWQARLQERLIAAVRDPQYRSPSKAKAVVFIDATDPRRAATDAVAAVEAMV